MIAGGDILAAVVGWTSENTGGGGGIECGGFDSMQGRKKFIGRDLFIYLLTGGWWMLAYLDSVQTALDGGIQPSRAPRRHLLLAR